jgi:hypothetical protein
MDDRTLDQRIRDVPTPGGLAARVAAGSFDDAALDHLLRDVPIPSGLARRIAAGATAPLPAPVIAGASRAAPRRRRPWQGVTAAARDLAVVAAALAGIWLVAEGGARLSSSLATVSPSRGVPASIVATRPERAAADSAPAERLRDAPEPTVAARAAERRPAAAGPSAASHGLASAAGEAAPVVAASVSTSPEVRGAGVGLAGEGRGWLRTPVRMPRDSWRRVPRVAGYDLVFEMTHGEPPFVDPKAAGLGTDTPPLTVQTDTFDRFRAAPRRGSGLRMEHVLAALPAIEPGPASAARPVSLTIRGVRSLRVASGRPTLLVEAAATAGQFIDRSPDEPPLDATIVLDRASGSEPLAWRWTCRGLAALATLMQGHDRLSVVVAGPVPQVVIRNAAGPDIERVAADLERLVPSATSDLDAAIATATALSSRGATAATMIVVAQEGVLESSGDDARDALGRWQARSAGGEGIRSDETWSGPDFVLIDAGTGFEPSMPAVSFGRTAADAVAIRRAMLAAVFGRDTLIAGRGRLTMEFEPDSVAAYRLVGHRQSAVESLSEALPATLDLHVGETVRVVYEVVPRAAKPVRAQARFTWATGGGERAAAAVLDGRADDCAAATPSPHGCELLLSVTAGEAACGSVHAVPHARAATAALVERWRARGDVTPFGETLAEAFTAGSR